MNNLVMKSLSSLRLILNKNITKHKIYLPSLISSSRILSSYSTSSISSYSTSSILSSSQVPITDFNDTVIVTKSCANRIKQLQSSAKNDQLFLRLLVEGGGCSGFKYVFKMESDTINDDDKIFIRDGCKVVIDEGSYDLVKGATIDFQQELIRSAFAIVNNPQSESACGCGSSFAVKNFTSNPALD